MISKYFIIRELNKKEWDNYFKEIYINNLLQTWEYGEAKQRKFFCKPYRFIIKSKNNKPIALIQIIIYKIFIIPIIAKVNRGPIIFQSAKYLIKNPKFNKEILKLIEFKLKKIGCFIIHITPDFIFDKNSSKEFIKNGYKSRKREALSSSLVSLRINKEELMMSFKPKWRNMLRKALKSDLKIKCFNGEKEYVNLLLEKYRKFKKLNNFKGVNLQLIQNLAIQNNSNWKFKIFICYKDIDSNVKDKLVGILVSIVHFNCATYFIGYTNQLGRKYNANYFMLWHSMIEAKKDKCIFYDMGGFNRNTPPGIVHFKKGVNGTFYENLPELYKFLIF